MGARTWGEVVVACGTIGPEPDRVGGPEQLVKRERELVRVALVELHGVGLVGVAAGGGLHVDGVAAERVVRRLAGELRREGRVLRGQRRDDVAVADRVVPARR